MWHNKSLLLVANFTPLTSFTCCNSGWLFTINNGQHEQTSRLFGCSANLASMILSYTKNFQSVCFMYQTYWCRKTLCQQYGCFLEWWYHQIIHFNRVLHYKPSIFENHHFRKPPYFKESWIAVPPGNRPPNIPSCSWRSRFDLDAPKAVLPIPAERQWQDLRWDRHVWWMIKKQLTHIFMDGINYCLPSLVGQILSAYPKHDLQWNLRKSAQQG